MSLSYRGDYAVINELDSAQLESSSQMVSLTLVENSVQFRQVLSHVWSMYCNGRVS